MSDSFKAGYEYLCQNFAAAQAGLSSSEITEWLEKIENQMDYDEISAEMVKLANERRTGVGQLQGDIAELWHARTFNINAAINKSGSVAEQLRENGYGSVDDRIITEDNKVLNFSSKSYAKYDGIGGSIHAQAETPWEDYCRLKANAEKHGKEYVSFQDFLKERGLDPDSSKLSKYLGQGKIISADQIDVGRNYLINKINNLKTRDDVDPIQIKRYQEVLDTLDSVIKDGKGTKSLELTHNQAIELATAAKKGNVSDELLKECGIDVDELVPMEMLAQEALNAGLDAAAMSLLLSVVPIIVDSISMLATEGEIDLRRLGNDGLDAISATAKAFVSGTLTAGIVIAAKTGKLENCLANINPKSVARLVSVSIGTICIASKCASGEIDKTEMAKSLMQMYIVTASSYLGGIAFKAYLSFIPFSYMLGSFIGGVVGGFVYKGVDSLLISYCIESGCTFFGLVNQDYTLPEEILNELGLSHITFDKLDNDEFEYNQFKTKTFNYNSFDYERIGLKVLRRDLIAVSTIGYV